MIQLQLNENETVQKTDIWLNPNHVVGVKLTKNVLVISTTEYSKSFALKYSIPECITYKNAQRFIFDVGRSKGGN